ncbi:unnamed protein product [Rhizoctonia solani]|uniref:Uncharacterized protein n=1 Tax=Rhizoctonia solani TaxID=456999 RepID=A0A8H3D512_9AGAM|nr:unnamed protein product [Rhizoctonia solani]
MIQPITLTFAKARSLMPLSASSYLNTCSIFNSDSGQGQFFQKPANAPLPSQENTNAPIPNLPRDAPDHQQEPQDTGPTNSGSNTPAPVREVPPNPNTSEPTITPQSNDKMDQLYQAQQETNRISRENEELLRSIKQTLITTYIKGRRQSYSSYSAYDTVNHKGESPRMYHLPEIYARDDSTLDRSISDEQVARYLRFYNIGTKLIREETGKLEPGKGAGAKRLLGHYVYYYRLPPDENA